MIGTTAVTLTEPEECDFWLETVAAHPVSPYDGSDEVTRRYSQWHCLLQFTVLTMTDAMAIEGFFAQARGPTIELNIPNFKVNTSLGTRTGTVTLNGNHSALATSLTITGGSGTFTPGTIVRVANQSHERLHYIIGGNGTTGIIIDPPLRFDLADTSQIRYRGDGSTATTDMRETMLLAGPLQGGRIFPSPGSDTTGGYITSRVVELVSSQRQPAA